LLEKHGKLQTLSVGPVADLRFLPQDWNLGDAQPTTRCKEIIMGDARVEAIILDAISRTVPQKRFHGLVQSAFAAPRDAELFCTHFGFKPREEQSYEGYRDAMCLFFSIAI
jgi:hypothetical protein